MKVQDIMTSKIYLVEFHEYAVMLTCPDTDKILRSMTPARFDQLMQEKELVRVSA